MALLGKFMSPIMNKVGVGVGRSLRILSSSLRAGENSDSLVSGGLYMTTKMEFSEWFLSTRSWITPLSKVLMHSALMLSLMKVHTLEHFLCSLSLRYRE